jgi:hypothetical protein
MKVRQQMKAILEKRHSKQLRHQLKKLAWHTDRPRGERGRNENIQRRSITKQEVQGI